MPISEELLDTLWKNALQLSDYNNDGKLTHKEITNQIQITFKNLPPQYVEQIKAQFDANGDGEMTEAEFKDWFRKNSG